MKYHLARENIISYESVPMIEFSELVAVYRKMGEDIQTDADTKSEFYTSLAKAIGVSVSNSMRKRR